MENFGWEDEDNDLSLKAEYGKEEDRIQIRRMYELNSINMTRSKCNRDGVKETACLFALPILISTLLYKRSTVYLREPHDFFRT